MREEAKVADEHGKAKHKPSRREFVKKAAYVTPAVLTLAVAPSYAKAGSEKGRDKGKNNNKGKNNDKHKDNGKGKGKGRD